MPGKRSKGNCDPSRTLGVPFGLGMQSMGWQKHTVRGFMAGAMKKAGVRRTGRGSVGTETGIAAWLATGGNRRRDGLQEGRCGQSAQGVGTFYRSDVAPSPSIRRWRLASA